MAECEERDYRYLVIPAITDIYVFAVECATSLRAVIDERRVILNAARKCERKFSRLLDYLVVGLKIESRNIPD
jgi:hypothetical protein